VWRGGYYAKVAVILSAVAIFFYLIDHPSGVPNGGSWLGYTYGTVGFGLIGWLAWFGIRRRRYGGQGPLEGWLSAHVYLGIALIVVATLHTGFRFHWNVHTLAFVLMSIVVISGIFGAYAFLRYPALMTANRAGSTLKTMSAELAGLDQQCRDLALTFDDEIAALVIAATQDNGGRFTFAEVFLGRTVNLIDGPTGKAISLLRDQVGGEHNAQPAEVLPLVQNLTKRATVVVKIRRDWRYRAQMLLWRAVHVPLTIALVLALTIHVFAVFYYR
jgi:hypothetical protein